MNRIVVIGVTGSGKTTFAGHLGRLFEMPHIELDALHWNPNWQESSREDFIKKVDAATWRHQREFPEKISDPAHEHLLKIRLRSPKEAGQWLEQVKQSRAKPGETLPAMKLEP